VRKRLEGFTEAAVAAGVRCSVLYDPEGATADPSEMACIERFSHDLREWVRGLACPLGILACADWWAADCLQACKDEGLRVPRDVAVMGVDNDVFRCEACRPSLTSVDRNMRQVGYEAAAVLVRYLTTGDWGKIPVMVPPAGVVERLSTDVLAVENPSLAAALRFVRSRFCDPSRSTTSPVPSACRRVGSGRRSKRNWASRWSARSAVCGSRRRATCCREATCPSILSRRPPDSLAKRRFATCSPRRSAFRRAYGAMDRGRGAHARTAEIGAASRNLPSPPSAMRRWSDVSAPEPLLPHAPVAPPAFSPRHDSPFPVKTSNQSVGTDN